MVDINARYSAYDQIVDRTYIGSRIPRPLASGERGTILSVARDEDSFHTEYRMSMQNAHNLILLLGPALEKDDEMARRATDSGPITDKNPNVTRMEAEQLTLTNSTGPATRQHTPIQLFRQIIIYRRHD